MTFLARLLLAGAAANCHTAMAQHDGPTKVAAHHKASDHGAAGKRPEIIPEQSPAPSEEESGGVDLYPAAEASGQVAEESGQPMLKGTTLQGSGSEGTKTESEDEKSEILVLRHSKLTKAEPVWGNPDSAAYTQQDFDAENSEDSDGNKREYEKTWDVLVAGDDKDVKDPLWMKEEVFVRSETARKNGNRFLNRKRGGLRSLGPYGEDRVDWLRTGLQAWEASDDLNRACYKIDAKLWEDMGHNTPQVDQSFDYSDDRHKTALQLIKLAVERMEQHEIKTKQPMGEFEKEYMEGLKETAKKLDYAFKSRGALEKLAIEVFGSHEATRKWVKRWLSYVHAQEQKERKATLTNFFEEVDAENEGMQM